MQADVGSKVRVHGLQHKPTLNGQQGTCIAWDCDLSAWEVQLDGGTLAAVKEANLELLSSQPKAAWAVEMFGKELRTKAGMMRTEDALAGKRAVFIYFCDRWCEPLPALADGYLNYDGSDIEVVFVSSDKHQSKSDFDDFCADMPWAIFVGDDVAADTLMQRFECTFVPFVPVLDGGDGTVACRNGRNAIESRADFATLLSQWRM
eukprot:TRINITY_DN56316_c0_g1_i1.p1 TRINITY_DN56316_c0_g1~~TRINITY_DN56316_c0_g1_i1.p1  ORF type:complete len:205 (+),score=39.24 TRINITY_DN56316_c0_g1_i1:49-663(+)